jgi:hypothetical protein
LHAAVGRNPAIELETLQLALERGGGGLEERERGAAEDTVCVDVVSGGAVTAD